jgi:chemotaxis protein methyltransferase CheR
VTQNSVQFFNLNLVKDSYSYPNYTPIQDVDLIICRNVFVYFEKDYINQVISKFFDVLKPGGYLITGHAELQGTENIEKFQAKIYPESMIYQRPIGLVKEPFTSPKSLIINRDNSWNNLLYSSRENQEFTINGKEQRNENHNLKPDTQFDAYYLLAQASANLGQYEPAIFYCQKAIEIDSLSIFPYYLLLHIAREQEDLAGAKLLSKRIIYLLPSSIPAYLELGSIYEQEKDHTRAAKMYSTALALLKSLPLSMRIEHLEGVTAEDLIVFLENKRLAIGTGELF